MASLVPCCCKREKSLMGEIAFCSPKGGAEVVVAELAFCSVTMGGGALTIVSSCSLKIC